MNRIFRELFNLVILPPILSVSFSVYGETYLGNIVNVTAGINYGDNVYLTMDPIPDPRPACATNSSYHFAFDATTSIGKIIYASAISAYLSGKEVRIQSYDRCEVVTNIDDLKNIRNQ